MKAKPQHAAQKISVRLFCVTRGEDFWIDQTIEFIVRFLMPRIYRLLVALSLGVSLSAGIRAESLDGGLPAAAGLLVLGRVPSADEIAAAEREGAKTAAQLREHFSKKLSAEKNARTLAAKQAWRDAFGRDPSQAELDAGAKEASYVGLLRAHVKALGENAADYDAVVERVYQQVIRREPYDREMTYWRERGPLPYFLVASALENWAQRNQPGLMVTGGTATVSINSNFLRGVVLMPDEAAALRAVFALQPEGHEAIANAGSRTIVAPGAAELVSNGPIFFAAAGVSVGEAQ
ncbi:MAG: hypothetical protein NVV63_15000 [Opitutus sp.]|nr:hypothetical protein [Opitutus sp.]